MKFKGLKRICAAANWDEALPIGNGTIGGLVFGEPLHETIITNHEELFLPMPENAESHPYNGKPYVEGMRKLLFEGKYREAFEYYSRGLEKDGAPYETIVWTNPFETASKIHFDMEEGRVEDYVQKLDFRTGEATVSFAYNGESVVRKSFVSRSRDIMATEIRKDGNPLSLEISMAPFKDAHHIESVTTVTDGEYLVCEATHSEEESGYISALRVITDGECDATPDSTFKVTKANYVLVFFTLAPWNLRMEAEKVKLLRILRDMTPDYEALFKEHVIIHKDLFEKVTVDFSDDETEYTNEELRDKCTADTLSPLLLERMCDMGRYMDIASFGKLPPNLQGVWNGLVSPPWSSDYTLDENIQMMMWPVLPGGLNGFSRVYFDWLESYTEDFKKNAESYYGCRGVFSAPRVTTDGYHRHYCHQWPMLTWTAGAGWLSSEYKRYYDYTGDENVLLRGVKYWKEVVLFYEDFLVEDADGKYVFAPSYSPENTPLGNDSPVTINATMDVSVAKEVYTNLIEACKILGIEDENISKWELECSKLPDYAVNEDGALKEWIPAELKDDYHHRHSSHLYMVFPGYEAIESGDDALMEACHKATKYRLIDGVEAISGWGLAHLANISARLQDSNLWYKAINRLVSVFTLGNLFTSHNEHVLFQMDANCGLTNAVYEMIAYSGEDRVKFFPVWRDDFDKLKVTGLRLKGVVRVQELVKNKDSFSVKMDSQGRKDIRVELPEGFSLENGDTELVLMAGEAIEFKAYRR
jgi:alpha-L-fucosidase 2